MIDRLPLLHQLTTQNSPIVILNGLPGSGKSTVLQQLAQYLDTDVHQNLPLPSDYENSAQLIWDPEESNFEAHIGRIFQLGPELERREQTLYLSASWVENSEALSQALLYGQITVIEQHCLMLSEQEIATIFPRNYPDVRLYTKGWPILVKNWRQLKSERYKESLQSYIDTKILKNLSENEQRLLVALAFTDSIPSNLTAVGDRRVEILGPLIAKDASGAFVLGIPALKQSLINIAHIKEGLYQRAMQLVAKSYFSTGQHLTAIKAAIETNNMDLAIRWFNQSGGGMYGYYHGFGELELVLSYFPTKILENELSLCWAKTLYLAKNQKLTEAKGFIDGLKILKQSYYQSEQDEAIATLILGKYDNYFVNVTEELMLAKLQKIEPKLSSDPRALMSYYGMVSINYSNLGDWFNAAVYQRKELDLSIKHNVPYLTFYCNFNLARINLRMGYADIAAKHISQAKKAIKQVSYYHFLTFERNFIDLIDGMLALINGDGKKALKNWNKVAILRKNSEVWPEFLTQFHFYGISSYLITDQSEDAGALLDQLHYEYQVCYSDEYAAPFFCLLSVLILQQQEHWVEAQNKLDSISSQQLQIAGSVAELYQWLSHRNHIGLTCIHRGRRTTTVTPPKHDDTAWMDMCYSLQELKLLWFNREYSVLEPKLLAVLNRAHKLNLWLPLLFEGSWVNPALKKMKTVEKQRVRHTQHEQAITAWIEKCKSGSGTSNSDGLTPKQLLIVQRLSEGLSNKQIALYTGLSESTVKFHLKNIFKRYKLKNRQALVQLANQKGWIQ